MTAPISTNTSQLVGRTILFVFLNAAVVSISFTCLSIWNVVWLPLGIASGILCSVGVTAAILLLAAPLLRFIAWPQAVWLRVTCATLPGWIGSVIILRTVLVESAWTPGGALICLFVGGAAALLSGLLTGFPVMKTHVN